MISWSEGHVVLKISRALVAKKTAEILAKFPVEDMNIREPEASTIVRELFLSHAGTKPV